MTKDELCARGRVVFNREKGLLAYVRATDGRRGREYAGGRTKALECAAECVTRMGDAFVDSVGANSVLDCFETASATFRRDGSNSVKASALRLMMAATTYGTRELESDKLRAHAKMLRRDYERATGSTKTVRGLILRLLGAIHVGLHSRGLALADDEAISDVPTVTWLLISACRILDAALDEEDDVRKEAVLMSSAIDAISSALRVYAKEDRAIHARVVRILGHVLSIPLARLRIDVVKAALSLLSAHAKTLRHELVTIAAMMFEKVLNMRGEKNKDVSRCACEAFDSLLPALADAFGNDAFSKDEVRAHSLELILKDVISTLDDVESPQRTKTACIRALGKFTQPALQLLPDKEAIVSSYMGRLSRLTLYIKFKDGANEFMARFESIERQVGLISAYSDLLRLPKVFIDSTLMETLATLVEWTWEQYAFEALKRKSFIEDAIMGLFVALSSHGCALKTFLDRVGSSLLALTLRVSPPDPIDAVLHAAPPVPMWPRYVVIWTHLNGGSVDKSKYYSYSEVDVNNVAGEFYSCFITQLLNLCKTLNLNVHTSVDDKEEKMHDDVAAAVSLGDEASAENLGDMQTFLQLIEWAQKVIDESPAEGLIPWVNPMCSELMDATNTNSSISGFYKLIGTVLRVADRASYFTQRGAAEKEQVILLFRSFLTEVLQDTRRFSGELLAAILRLLLSMPSVILSVVELVSPLKRALEVGLQHPPTAEVALDTLEGWLEEEHLDELSPYFPSIAHHLNVYLESIDATKPIFSTNEISSDAEQNTAALWRNRKRKRDGAQEESFFTDGTYTRIVKILGMMGGAVHGLVPEKSALSEEHANTPWSFESKISVPFGLVRSSSKLWLDKLLPRLSHLALHSRDRVLKISACEGIYGITVFLIGKSAQGPASNAGDFTRTESKYRSVFERLFPIILELAVDVEPVAQQLFHSLSFQMTRWYAKSQARELDTTLCLFDAMISGLANTSKAGAIRDLCSNLIVELLEWSLKYVPDGHSFDHCVNHKYIFRTLYGLMSHARVAHRLGAIAAVRKCLGHVEKNRELVKAYALEISQVVFRSLVRSSEREISAPSSGRGSDVPMAILIREVMEIIHKHMQSLTDTSTLPVIEDLCMTLLQASMSIDEFVRREGQLAFNSIAPGAISDVGKWMMHHTTFVACHIDSSVPSAVHPLSEVALKKFVAVTQWSRWIVNSGHGGSKLFESSRKTHFQAMREYLLRVAAESDNCNVSSELVQEILLLMDSILNANLSDGEKDDLLTVIINQDDELMVGKLVTLAIFAPHLMGESVSVHARSKSLMSFGAKLLRSLSDKNVTSFTSRVFETTKNCLKEAISKDFDLGLADLETTEGCLASKKLAEGYRELANVSMLKKILPKEGDLSAQNLTHRMVNAVYRQSHRASPPQVLVSKMMIQLCLHLNMKPESLLDLLIDQNSLAYEDKHGEEFYRNHKDCILRACKYQFGDYAERLFAVAGKDMETSGGVIASDLIAGVLDLVISKVPKGDDRGAKILLNTAKKNSDSLRFLFDGSVSRSSSDVKDAAHKRFLGLVSKMVALDSGLSQKSELFSDEDDAIFAGLIMCVRGDHIALSSHLDALTLIAEVLKGCDIPLHLRERLIKTLENLLKNLPTQERCTPAEFSKRFPSTIKAFRQAFKICQVPSILATTLPFCNVADVHSLLRDKDSRIDSALTQCIWDLTANAMKPFETRLLSVETVLPEVLSRLSPEDIAAFYAKNASAILADFTRAPDEGELLVRIRNLLLTRELYARCSKDSVSAVTSAIPKFNATISKTVMSELAGLGVAKHARLGEEKIAVHILQLAFSTFAALLVCTQTDVKFYARIFDMSPTHWNNLTNRLEKLDPEFDRSASSSQDLQTNTSDKERKNVSFTLSSTIAALHATLGTSDQAAEKPTISASDGITSDEKSTKALPRDGLEASPVCDSLFKILKFTIEHGLTGEVQSGSPQLHILNSVCILLQSPDLSPKIKLLIVKAILRLNHVFSATDGDVQMTSIATSPSLLVAHPELMVATLTALTDITKASDRVISTPLREALVVAFSADQLWTSSFEDAKPCLLELFEMTLKNAPSDGATVMIENVKLMSQFFVRLREGMVYSGSKSSHIFQTVFDCIHAYLTSHEKDAKYKQMTMIQLLGTLLQNKVIAILDDSVAVISTEGVPLGTPISVPLVSGIMSCLMRPNATSGRKLNSAAASLLGKIMATARGHAAFSPNVICENLKVLFKTGTFDVFLDVLDRLTHHCPKFVHEAGFAPQVHSLLDKVHGEPKYVALTILTKEHSSDIAKSTCERMLPFVPLLIKQKDAQTMELVFSALTRGLEASKKSKKKRDDVQLWKAALSESDKCVDSESVVNVRDAHAHMCIAVGEIYPELMDEPSVRNPLLRCLADQISQQNRENAIRFWNRRLASDNLANRFHGILHLVPSKSMEGLWLPAACRLLYAVQDMNPANGAPLIENDLSECTFASANVNTRRKRVTRTMLPLFSAVQGENNIDEAGELELRTLILKKTQHLVDPLIVARQSDQMPSLRLSKAGVKPYSDANATQGIGQAMSAPLNQEKLEKFIRDEQKATIKLTRLYRTGDLPDVKLSLRELMSPLLLVAEGDSTFACALLVELSRSAREEFDFLQRDAKRSEESTSETAKILAEPFKQFAKQIEGRDGSLVRFLLGLCEVIPEAKVPAEHVVRLSLSSNNLSSGIVAMDALINSGEQSTDEWCALARLCKSTGQDDAALLAFVHAFPYQNDTLTAIRQEMSGNLQSAFSSYKALLSDKTERSQQEQDFWKREYFACAEKLGEWGALEEELASTRTEPVNLDMLDIFDCIIPGEASGGAALSSAVRVAIRQPLVDWSSWLENLISHESSSSKLLKSVHLELALHTICEDKRDETKRLLSHVFDEFIGQWVQTHPSSIAIRRKLIQVLQPAVEVDETLKILTEMKNVQVSNHASVAEVDKMVERLKYKWSRRWPSARCDTSEVWERVVTFRSKLLSVISGEIPELHTERIRTMRTNLYLNAAEGLRQVGQVLLSQKMLRSYIEMVGQSNDADSWKLYEALFKLKLSSGSENAVRKALEMCQAQREEQKWRGDDNLSCMILEGRMSEQLAYANQADSTNYGIQAVNRYMDAIREANLNNAPAHEMDASLRLAHFCDTALKQLRGENSIKTVSVECAESLNSWFTADPEQESSLTDVFMRSAIKALEISGTQNSSSARQLLPRLLVLLRTSVSIADVQKYSQAILRIPTWLFLDWIPQILSMLSDEVSRGVVAPLVQKLVSRYPGAVRPHFNLTKEDMDDAVSHRMERALHSSIHEGFNRAIELLDSPLNRLKWWRQQIELRERQRESHLVAKLIAAMKLDVANTTDPLIGPLNANFTNIASNLLDKHLDSAENSTSVAEIIKRAENEIVIAWGSAGAEFEKATRLRIGDLSTWFTNFDSLSTNYVTLEIPGQYDALMSPPDVDRHVSVVGFAPEVQIFDSKQRPNKITLRGSDGREYQFIAKGGEDLRQDERIQRLYRAMNGLLNSSAESRGRRLRLRTFHVAPLSNRSGLLEFVPNTSTILKLTARGQGADIFAQHQTWIKEQALGVHKGKRLRDEQVDNIGYVDYLEAMGKASKDDCQAILSRLGQNAAPRDALRNVLSSCSGSAESFVIMRQQFSVSLAASSICGYVAGVGDRHLENILLDTSSGELVHIDFGYAFGTAASALPIPELVPFRATPILINTLKPLDAKTWLETDMTRTMKALHDGSTLLKGVMDIFLRDPLIDWEREELCTRKKSSSSHSEERIARACGKLELANPTAILLQECSAKHKSRPYWNSMRAVLGGSETNDTKCRDIEEQVEALLELATNPEVLAVSWSGWRPWL